MLPGDKLLIQYVLKFMLLVYPYTILSMGAISAD
jgi:hypothetical protein